MLTINVISCGRAYIYSSEFSDSKIVGFEAKVIKSNKNFLKLKLWANNNTKYNMLYSYDMHI